MSKKKKFKDDWERIVHTVTTRKRSERQYKLPYAYIFSVADSIHKATPSRDIIFNTLVKLSGDIYEEAYLRRIDDAKLFKEKQEKHISDDWNVQKDLIDDLIHNK